MRLTSTGLKEANAPLRDKVDNEDEPQFMSKMMMQNLGIDSKRDDENSFEEDVEEHFDKFELMNKFHDGMM